MGAKFFIDNTNYPNVDGMVRGQSLTITLTGTVDSVTPTGISFNIEGMKVGKKGKMNTQEVLLANRLDRIEQKLPGQSVAM